MNLLSRLFSAQARTKNTMSGKLFIVLLATIPFVATNVAISQNEESTTVGGYGELHYNEPDGTQKGQLDFHRFILYLDHNFNSWITFKSETELEHANATAGEAGLRQTHLR